MLDTVIKNASIIDGTGAPAFLGDIGIKDGRISLVGDASAYDAREIVDAAGLFACPGFVDSHSHADYTALLSLPGANALLQGITTAVCGNCGGGVTPFCAETMEPKRALVGDEVFAYLKSACKDYTSFTSALDATALPYNIALYIPHGNLRELVMGFKSDAPTESELASMLDIVSEGMERGALGFSTGLVYAPSLYAKQAEIDAVASTVARYSGGYTSHIRNEGDTEGAAIAEAIGVAERANIPLTVSHLKVEGKKNHGSARDMLSLIEAARGRGVNVHADQYPYAAGSAPLIYQIPPRFLEQGLDRAISELASSEALRDMEREIFIPKDGFESAIYASGYDGTMITLAPGMEEITGLTLADIAIKYKLTPFEALRKVVAGTNGAAQGIYFSQGESDLMEIMRNPLVACGTDWMDIIEPMDEGKQGGAHPRAMGSMPRRIRLLLDDGRESLESIIRRVTSLPADMAGLGEIGRLKAGMRADITVIDAKSIRDNADYIHPYKNNSGISYVFVSGRKAVESGKLTGEKAGKLLRKKEGR